MIYRFSIQTLAIILLFPIYIVAQTASVHINNGKQEEEALNYESAIKEYSSAIEIDSADYEPYYLRAALLFESEKYTEALSDLNQAIILRPSQMDAKAEMTYIESLFLRGKTNLKLGDVENGCKDFLEANTYNSIPEEYLNLCNYKPEVPEFLIIDFPDPENWKIKLETLENGKNWTLINHYVNNAINERPAERFYKAFSENSDFDIAINDAYKNIKEKKFKNTVECRKK